MRNNLFASARICGFNVWFLKIRAVFPGNSEELKEKPF